MKFSWTVPAPVMMEQEARLTSTNPPCPREANRDRPTCWWGRKTVRRLGKLCQFFIMLDVNSPGDPAASCRGCSLEKRSRVPTQTAAGRGPWRRDHSSCTLGGTAVCANSRLCSACCVPTAGPWSALKASCKGSCIYMRKLSLRKFHSPLDLWLHIATKGVGRTRGGGQPSPLLSDFMTEKARLCVSTHRLCGCREPPNSPKHESPIL